MLRVVPEGEDLPSEEPLNLEQQDDCLHAECPEHFPACGLGFRSVAVVI